ncbi:hypothetical protein LPTSP4_17280 [Leptospira ryugenii]|uniref:Uncharacterized protein n=1 Tax=Leptospira ryugenii TaxID=1917863 RepID=A0A2P2DZY5_9LEPT|nr:hypothetical protein [Leptospira ryugenii]GBF50204.1 hypothetical protein LPTSP4_17280 [Leptospira ryugenii]
MVRIWIQGFGITFLALCLSSSFLSNDQTLVRLKAGAYKRSIGNRQGLSQVVSLSYGSVDQEESKDKEISDSLVKNEAKFAFPHEMETAALDPKTASNRSYLLQDSYLSLPPPV